MENICRSDVSVLIEIIADLSKRAKYLFDKGVLSDQDYKYLINATYKRSFDEEINDALDDILKALMGEDVDE